MFLRVVEFLFFIDLLSGRNSCFFGKWKMVISRMDVWIDFYAVFVVFKWVEHRTAWLGKTANVIFYNIKAYEIELELLNVMSAMTLLILILFNKDPYLWMHWKVRDNISLFQISECVSRPIKFVTSRRSVVDNVSAEHLTVICGNIFLISRTKRGLNKSHVCFFPGI